MPISTKIVLGSEKKRSQMPWHCMQMAIWVVGVMDQLSRLFSRIWMGAAFSELGLDYRL